MAKKRTTVSVLVRDFPIDLLAQVSEYAEKYRGETGKASRVHAIIALVRKGLQP
jgi:hypothetical protein